MAYLTGEPRVDIREIDLSQVITSSSSNVGVIVGQAERGPVNKRVLITLDTDFTSIFGTPDTSKYGFLSSTALTFLQGSNQLYVTRVVGNGASFAGAVIDPASESTRTDTLLTVAQDTSYPVQVQLSEKPVVYSSIEINVGESHIASIDDEGNIYMDDTTSSFVLTGRYSYTTNTMVITSCTFAAGSVISVSYSYVVSPSPAVAQLEDGTMTSEDYDFSYYSDAVMAVYADNQGAWGNNIKFSIGNIDTRDNTFDITVYETVNNIDLQREIWHVSRKEQLDGMGNQLYMEDAINGNSLFIRVKDLKKDNDELLPAEVSKIDGLLAGGLNGDAPTQSQIAAGYDLYSSWEDIDVDILMDAGYVSENETTVQNKIKNICESRQDCVGVFEVPYNQTSMSPTTKCTDWRQNLQAINSSYTGLYTPWIKARDTYKNKIIEIPPCGYIGAIMAQLDDTYYAPAGLEQGILNSDAFPVVGLTQDYTTGQKSTLYDAGVNVIKSYPSVGYVAWGQKTQQTKASALDRWNVRRSLNTIKRAIRKAYMYQLFKNNDEWTRASLTNAVTEYMNTRKKAFYDFKVICDETNNTPEVIDRNHIVLTVMVKPVKTAEYGILNIVITSTGVEFSSVEGSITV